MEKRIADYSVPIILLAIVLVYVFTILSVEKVEEISVMLSPTQLGFGWTDTSNNENGFRIEASTDSNFLTGVFMVCDVGVNVETCSYSLSSLVVGTTYYFRLWAWNSQGNSGYVTNFMTIPTQCADTFDNELIPDGAIDYPADFSCSSAADNDETNPLAQCQDGIDNDGDGVVDLLDIGCANNQDNDEYNAPLIACGNGVVEQGEFCDDNNLNNNDGCSSTCQIEAGWICSGGLSVCVRTICNNGIDDDGDNLIDFPADTACANINDNNEGVLGTSAVCGNNVPETNELCGEPSLTCPSGNTCSSCLCLQISPGLCSSGNTQSCVVSGQQGVCATGTQTCVVATGQFGVCIGPSPGTETCNNLDDDCDGQTDEGLSCGVVVTSSGGGGGGGGGGGVVASNAFSWLRTTDLSDVDSTSFTFKLSARERVKVLIDGTAYFVGVLEKQNVKAKIVVSATPEQSAVLGVSESREFILNGGKKLVVKITQLEGNKFTLSFTRESQIVFMECNDLNDNDQDGRIDLQDSGCNNAQDNDESNDATASVESVKPSLPEVRRETNKSIFWLVVVTLAVGCVVLVVMILRMIRTRRRFAGLVARNNL